MRRRCRGQQQLKYCKCCERRMRAHRLGRAALSCCHSRVAETRDSDRGRAPFSKHWTWRPPWAVPLEAPRRALMAACLLACALPAPRARGGGSCCALMLQLAAAGSPAAAGSQYINMYGMYGILYADQLIQLCTQPYVRAEPGARRARGARRPRGTCRLK
eukprot:SAG31_NODE_431_length_15775_cov_3.350663_12_plen_160_part_00